MKARRLPCTTLLLSLAVQALAQNEVLELDGKGAHVQLPGHIFDHL